MKKIIAVILASCCLLCASCSQEKTRAQMDQKERLQAALDDIFNGEAYDIDIELKLDMMDGDHSQRINTHVVKNTVNDVPHIHLQRINEDGTTDEYYIGNKYYKADGTLSHANYTFELESETLFIDLTPQLMGDYNYVDGEQYKTYEFTVPKAKLTTFMTEGSGMKATKADGSIVLGLDGYPDAFRIEAVSEFWVSDNSFYEYDVRLTVTVNAVGDATQKVVIPFEVNK